MPYVAFFEALSLLSLLRLVLGLLVILPIEGPFLVIQSLHTKTKDKKHGKESPTHLFKFYSFYLNEMLLHFSISSKMKVLLKLLPTQNDKNMVNNLVYIVMSFRALYIFICPANLH